MVSFTLWDGEYSTLVESGSNSLPSVWYYGPRITDCLDAALSTYPHPFHKSFDRSWVGYDYQDNVLLQDVYPHHRNQIDLIRDWLTDIPFPVLVDNNHTAYITPKKIIFISNYSPYSIWPQSHKALSFIFSKCQLIHVQPTSCNLISSVFPVESINTDL